MEKLMNTRANNGAQKATKNLNINRGLIVWERGGLDWKEFVWTRTYYVGGVPKAIGSYCEGDDLKSVPSCASDFIRTHTFTASSRWNLGEYKFKTREQMDAVWKKLDRIMRRSVSGAFLILARAYWFEIYLEDEQDLVFLKLDDEQFASKIRKLSPDIEEIQTPPGLLDDTHTN